MSRDLFGIRLVCAIAASVVMAAPAAAQAERPTGGPFSGLFKGSPKEQPHTLDLRASAFGVWDDNILSQVPNVAAGEGSSNVDPRFLKQGVAGGFQGSLAYGFRRNGTRSQFSVRGDAAVQQFASGLGGGALWFHNYNGSTGLKTSITNKISMSLGAGAAYAPYYQYAPFLKNTTSEESPVGADQGFAVQSTWVRSTSASASVSNQFSKKSNISAGIGWDQRVMPGNEDLNVDSRSAQATFNHSVTRKLAFHLGYGIMDQRSALSPDAKPVRSHNMDVGLGYGDGITLTFGRHYTLGLSIGGSIAKNGDPVSVATTGKSTVFVLTGGALLSRSIGRSWGASLGYSRGTSYMVGFRDPIIADSANVGIGGTLSSRLQFSAGGGATRGQQLFVTSSGSIVSYTASTRLTYAMFKHLGLYGQASYYRFSIPANFTNFGFVPDLDRRSASVGLSTWLPLIKQRRARQDPGGQITTGQQ